MLRDRQSHIITKIYKSDLGNRFLNGAFWSLLGAISGRGFVLLSFIFVARILGQHTYGELGIIRSTINMFTVFAGMGIGATASKFISQYRNNEPNRIIDIYSLSNTISIIIGFIGAFSLIVFSPYIADKSLEAPYLTFEIQLGAIVLLFTTINGAQSGALSGFEDFKSIALNTFISGTIQSLLLVLLSYYYGISGCIIALGFGCIFLSLFNHFSLKKQLTKYNTKHKQTYLLMRISKDMIKILWSFSLPTVLSSILVIPVLWWARTFLISKSSFSEMAIFDIADQWSIMVLFIPSTLTQITLPLLSNTLSGNKHIQYIKLVKANIILNIAISFVISAFVILLRKYILELYGKEFIDTTPLIFMMISSIMISGCNVVGQVIASRGKMWHAFFFNAIWSIWIILFTLLFVNQNLGASGLAIAITISYFLHFIAQIIYLKKVLQFNI
ncbi:MULTISPECIES: oligosaccharide flippase family protein [Parabacteroides]|jgi:O-antigen/teichoic acid export membrane protein|uniref:oligosaccharide flippase family protein n=1 Tax=Parabacteroides TaxID=375288 RepID=UPI000F00E100|nr:MULTISPECIES: oligosaccharide flippase family protein [Parabacteroides]RKU63132.1 hypothetical protein DWW91_25335 [Parabacteroides sp. AF17-3]